MIQLYRKEVTMQAYCAHCGEVFNSLRRSRYCAKTACQKAKLIQWKERSKELMRIRQGYYDAPKYKVCRHCGATTKSARVCTKSECLALEQIRLSERRKKYNSRKRDRSSGIPKLNKENGYFCQRCQRLNKTTALVGDERYNCKPCRIIMEKHLASTEPDYLYD